jgi:hypothetical protein
MERPKRAYRVSTEPPLERASGGISSNALYGRRSKVSRQASMSYPGQGRPADALGSDQNKAKPEGRCPGRSKPSTQENIHPKRKQTVGRQPKKGRSS